MAKLVDFGSGIEPEHGYPIRDTKIELDINLVNNKHFIYDANDPNYRNWIPFEFRLQVGENELYEYPEEFGATFNVEELNNWFLGMEKLYKEIEIMEQSGIHFLESKPIMFSFFTLETYFGMDFKYAGEYHISVTVWIVMSRLPNSELLGFHRGIRYGATMEEVKIFMAELKNELDCLIKTTEK
ncbi:MAG: hypothetical protein FWC91_12115 [Defluviitaleaceae bacterium]|nr:hypothetical protein [Defluviitaleaceae bacterium]